MNRFIVSARKYRPSLFKEVKGQSHVTVTLCNQLKEKTVPQVVLFCGPRGTGKTSCGRIFAKAINCQSLNALGEPCNQCISCQQFQQKTSFNIYELDAASHNSVEDARQLLEQVRFHPASGKKVFIIDEVHMLSNAAFNALLKTLEEPPAHVVFILATTEKHKIIPTILSRCQVFDFLPIPPQEIFFQLEHIAKEEGIEAEKDALHLISEYSEGSFREALHAFDKIVAFGGGKKMTKEGVLSHLHILDYTYYFKLTDHFIEANIGKALQTYNEILRLGFESHHFLQGLTKHVRHLLVAQTATDILQMGAGMVGQYKAQTERVEAGFLCDLLKVLEQCELYYKERQDKRLHVELTLIKLARLDAAPSSRAEGTSYKTATPKSQEPKERIPNTENTSPSQPREASPTPPREAARPPLTTQEKQEKAPYKATTPTTQEPQASISNTENTSPSQSIEASPPPPKEAATPPLSNQEKQEGVTSLTLEEVKKAWNTYMDKLKAKGAMSAYATLKSPLHLEENTIVLQIANALQRNTLHIHAHDLLAFMQNSLQNPSLRIITKVISSPEESLKNASPKNQMEHLVEKYPVVDELRTALDLTC
ncbi:MAG: DNA polymerase III subunit gamma/tau [Bacteroidota bacterium]